MGKISARTAGGAMDGTELIPGVKPNGGGFDERSWTAAQIATLARNGASAAEIATLIGVTGDVQTQLDQLDTDISAVSASDALKAPKAWPNPGALAGGNTILFTENRVYGRFSAPITGNVAADMTGAVIGTKVVILHNDVTPPTLPGNEKSSSAGYVNSALNYIEFSCYDTAAGGVNLVYEIYQA